MNNVLLLSAGRRVELAQSFKAEIQSRKMDSRLYAVDLNPSLSAACQVADGFFQAPRVTAPEYTEYLLDLCLARGIGLVVPTIDTELLVLSAHREAFAEKGVHLIVSDEALVRDCRDKRRTAALFNELDIHTPEIYARDAIQYPCFAKPYDGSCSIGAAVLRDPSALSTEMLNDEKMMFMELVDGSHTEFTVDVYYNRRGEMTCMVPRQRIEVRGGEISKGATRKNHVYDYLLPRLSKIKGARGCLTAQLFANEKTKSYRALEINPRFGGGFPLSYSAGANYPGWLLDEYLLNKDVSFFESWEPDLMMLRYDAKVLVHGAC